ncbi:MAG: ArsR family transcriptional regulator [Candidatus Odinarchaeota archaeon]
MNDRSFLISEFSSPKRVDILQILVDGPISFTELSNKLDISSSEVSRHLARLTDQGFVKKHQTSRKFELAPLGELASLLFSPLDFVFSQADYFRTHSVTDIPVSLIRDLDVLSTCEMVEGTGFAMLKLPEIINSVRSELRVMTSQPFPWGKPGLDVKYIVPPSMMQFKEQIVRMNRSTEARILPSISISIIITESGEGMLFFPDLEGKTDYDTGFYISKGNKTGQKFIERIWDYFWSTGDIPDS